MLALLGAGADRATYGDEKRLDRCLVSTRRNNYFFGDRARTPLPIETGLDLEIRELAAAVPELNGKQAADFIDATLLREVEKEGFFSAETVN